ncbi:formyltetrahydrofolate deformylase [Paramagnetospirillum kuznetsovii]|uniref:Formyltetrahydrofolate deformylase n=1 Tax=Paramagnetospirillum kuznetsovii TaxID=2053833 RepID=A0A364NY96_9PROT|nr:formyltetrahydrofolate deformylase [Paramagnetospirillum kuznetsovii]RAU22023.1 formyltetrahydrofolate deformylase [Paramagnetospirillum kuznetsovii]
MADKQAWILTITCPDTVGIVAAVSGFLSQHDCFITEAAQYGDPLSSRFFMRIVFGPGAMTPAKAEFEKLFTQVAARFQMIWRLHDASRKARVVILVSKFGHCLNDLLHRYHTGSLGVEIPAVISNHQDMRSIVEWHGIPYHYVAVDKHDKSAQEARVLDVIERADADLVVLARYMQILSQDMCARLQGKAINIHHSFLPSFKGAKPYHQAHARGVKIIGATAHYVTPDLDEGPIIEQGVERVDHTHTPEDLVAIGRDIENVVLARAVRWHTEQRVLLNGSKTVVFR